MSIPQPNNQFFLQQAATATGNGTPFASAGYKTVYLELQETAAGTATVQLRGSFDGVTFYAVGYQLVDNTASPARAVADLSVTASMKHVYQILDAYPILQAGISAVAGGGTVTVKAYAVPI